MKINIKLLLTLLFTMTTFGSYLKSADALTADVTQDEQLSPQSKTQRQALVQTLRKCIRQASAVEEDAKERLRTALLAISAFEMDASTSPRAYASLETTNIRALAEETTEGLIGSANQFLAQQERVTGARRLVYAAIKHLGHK